MRRARAVVCVVGLSGVLVGGCGEAAPAAEEPGAVESASTPVGAAAPLSVLGGAVGGDEPPTCLRGGMPREDVRRILGEPDSISFGAWLYGSSEIQFGYGVVLETRDPDGRLRLCG